MICSYCQKKIIRNLSIKELLLPWQIPKGELCTRCKALFVPLRKENSCLGCMRQETTGVCEDCQNWQAEYPRYDFCHQALFAYEEHFAQWLTDYKFMGDYRLRYTFCQEVAHALKPYSDFILCPLPLSPERLNQRGFNQTSGFLKGAGLAYQELLVRLKTDVPQSKKKRAERLALTQPYVLNGSPEVIHGKKILLVDDVYTTGRTMFHAAEVILRAKPGLLRTFSLAR
ncbi:ComF family protein [Enterococcus sp. 2201sp1_2201st1_B8_2201SCRN_220225]|uniref:ComF family protein n=1 Tax=unclassified Enterococcus TaxID=2608891 RepID=UPI0034A3B868